MSSRVRHATVGVLVLAAGALTIQAAPAQAAPNCFGKPLTITGTDGPDVQIGTFGKDSISTFGGNDVVRGDADFGGATGGDDDAICMGTGDDVADGAVGSDLLSGGIGNDVLDGDGSSASVGRDTLVGGEGNDVITGGGAGDLVLAGPGDDIVDPPGAGLGEPASAGADLVLLGIGDDLVNEDDGVADLVYGGPGNDTCVGDVADRLLECETVIRVPATTDAAK